MQHLSFQQSDGFCGPASLKIALAHFGIEVSEKKLAKLSKCTSKLGATAGNLLKASNKFGVKGFIKENCNLSDLKKYLANKKYVIIVDWFLEDDGHYGVVTKMDKENIYLQDPDLGHMRAIRLDIFLRLWFTFDDAYMKTKSDLILRRAIFLHR